MTPISALVVGAGGFLGRSLVRELKSRGHTVHELSSSGPGGIDRVRGLFTDVPSIPPGIEAVYYVAQSPRAHETASSRAHAFAVNVLSAIECADAASAAGVRRFFYTSTGNVYQSSFDPLPETAPLNRGTLYSLTKIHAEEALRLYRDMDVTCVRLFGLYGPGQTERLVPRLVAAIKGGLPISLEPREGDDESTDGLRISLCHVEDAARIMVDLVPQQRIPAINVASSEVLSIRTIADMIGRHTGLSVRWRLSERKRTFDLIADVSKLQSLLSPAFTPFEAGLRKTLSSCPS